SAGSQKETHRSHGSDRTYRIRRVICTKNTGSSTLFTCRSALCVSIWKFFMITTTSVKLSAMRWVRHTTGLQCRTPMKDLSRRRSISLSYLSKEGLKMTKVAIIGAGITGLSASYYLTESNQNIEVDLFEKAGHAGGKIYTYRKDGYVIELGPESYLSRKEAL